jgi:hypothetical protein
MLTRIFMHSSLLRSFRRDHAREVYRPLIQ